ncbi:MAG TPA: hypothetical protein VK689_15455 [Armatimonadota bacterium]|nr:hypothetical protein [Armatimonadota bacterium]
MSHFLANPAAAEAMRALIVAAALLTLIWLAEWWRRLWHPPVEWTRKLVHCGAGLIATLFPYLFGSVWTVLALGGGLGLFLRLTRRTGMLQSIHGVERHSHGDLYYLAAVLLLFVLGRSWPVFYLVSLLVLILSDTLAAILGSAYGRWSYSVETSRRSAEGSAVFFMATFLCVHLPLLLLTPLDRLAGVLIGLQIALLVTSFEAISLRGSDNLIVPLATFYLLVKMTPYPATRIGLLILSELLILAVVALVAWRSGLLTVSGTVAAHLFFYGAWALRGPGWALAPALALAGFLIVNRYTGSPTRKHSRQYQVLAVLHVTAVAVALYLLDNTFRTLLPLPPWLRVGQPLYAAYAGVLAAQLAILACNRPLSDEESPCRWLLSVMAAFALVVPPALWLVGWNWGAWIVASGTCLGGVAGYIALRSCAPSPRGPLSDLRLQTSGIALAALVSVLVHGALTAGG